MTIQRLLIIKMSSLGDLIHLFPAITELKRAHPDIKIDWVVEEAFAEVPRWHAAVNRVIPIALRRWRHSLYQSRHEIRAFLKTLRSVQYDVVIDAQGLIKSAMVSKLAKARQRHGFDADVLREPIARLFYHQMHATKERHVVYQYCDLFSQSLGYSRNSQVKYDVAVTPKPYIHEPYLFCFHGTTWETKHWPEGYWEHFIELMRAYPYRLIFPWGNAVEQKRALSFQSKYPEIIVLPRYGLTDLVSFIRAAAACVSVDTGLGHIAAACEIPTVFLFGPTASDRVGGLLPSQFNLQAQRDCVPCHQKQCRFQKTAAFPPCYQSLPPQKAVEALSKNLLKELCV